MSYALWKVALLFLQAAKSECIGTALCLLGAWGLFGGRAALYLLTRATLQRSFCCLA